MSTSMKNTYKVWKRIKIGGSEIDLLISKLRKIYRPDSRKRNYPFDPVVRIMKDRMFSLSTTVSSIDLIRLTPADLGFTESPTIEELLNTTRLNDWSKLNLDGFTVEPCPSEVALNLCIQNTDPLPSKTETIWIAMSPICDMMFYIQNTDRKYGLRFDTGFGRGMYAWYTGKDVTCLLDRLFVFCLRKTT